MKGWLSRKLHKSSLGSESGSSSPSRVEGSYINAVYYPNWKAYNGQGPSSLAIDRITHVFYAFMWPAEDGTLTSSDSYADMEIEVDGVKGCLAALAALKSKHKHLKTILSIGGGGQGSSKFSQIARSSSLRQDFARNLRNLVDAHGFDGADIDWEHPQDPREGDSYVKLLADLRVALPSPNYMLTSALPAGEWALKNINLSSAISYLDFANIMAYDFSGPWTPQAGHHAQLYAAKRPHSDAARISGDSAVQYFLAKNVPSYKVVLGIPVYGRSFLGAKTVGDACSGHAGDEGTFEYRVLPRPGTTEQIDRATVAAYCVGGDGGFVTYDTAETVRLKADYARNRQLGGLFYWTGTADVQDSSRSLIAAGFEALRGFMD